MDITIDLIKKAYEKFEILSKHYDDINKYYYGTTDALKDFKPIEGRSNLKANTNFVQKLVDEEATYSFGNSVTYISNDGNTEVTKDIEYSLKNNSEDHDINLGMELVKNGICYEANYLDKEGKFKNKIISPLDGYMYRVNDEPVLFLHSHTEDTENGEETFIDVYTDNQIMYLDSQYNIVSPSISHYFGIIPIGYGVIGGVEYNENRGYVEGDKTIYRAIKTLQDAFETNLSDMVSEISDFRNAILKLYNVTLEKNEDGSQKTDQPIVRENAVLFFGDKATQDAEWLIKNINDTFIKNTRDDVKDLIYTITCHIDNNEKMQSNLSGIALRSRLQMLESKCKMNEKAMANILKTRLKCLFRYLFQTENKEYDVNLVKIQFTPNIPVDIISNADLVSKVPHEVISYKTMRTLFPFVTDADSEQLQIDNENSAAAPEIDLNNVDTSNADNINTADVVDAVEEVSTKSLNGAQTQSLMAVMQQYSSGALTIGQAINIVSISIGVTKEEAKSIIEGAS